MIPSLLKIYSNNDGCTHIFFWNHRSVAQNGDASETALSRVLHRLTVPVHVVADEGDVEEEGEELAGDEEKRVEEDVEDVLGQHERVEAVALVDRVLVVRLQLVECDDLRKGKQHLLSISSCALDTRNYALNRR